MVKYEERQLLDSRIIMIGSNKKDCGGVRPAIRKLSKESGIPIRTIERWVWPDKISAKNGAIQKCQAGETCALFDIHRRNIPF